LFSAFECWYLFSYFFSHTRETRDRGTTLEKMSLVLFVVFVLSCLCSVNACEETCSLWWTPYPVCLNWTPSTVWALDGQYPVGKNLGKKRNKLGNPTHRRAHWRIGRNNTHTSSNQKIKKKEKEYKTKLSICSSLLSLLPFFYFIFHKRERNFFLGPSLVFQVFNCFSFVGCRSPVACRTNWALRIPLDRGTSGGEREITPYCRMKYICIHYLVRGG
jgi:hypothetical protein